MRIQTDSILCETNIETAIKFGFASSDMVDAEKYTIAFMKRLLLHREKLEKNLLEAHLNPLIAKTMAGSALQSGGHKAEADQHP